MLAVKIGVTSISFVIFLFLGYWSHPIHKYQGVKNIAYLPEGLLIWLIGFFLTCLLIIGIDFFLPSNYILVNNYIYFYSKISLIPSSWIPGFVQNNTSLTINDWAQFLITIIFIYFIIDYLKSYRLKKAKEELFKLPFVLCNKNGNELAGNILSIRFENDGKEIFYCVKPSYKKIGDRWNSITSNSEIEVSSINISHKYTSEKDFRIEQGNIFEKDPNARITEVILRPMQKTASKHKYLKNQKFSILINDPHSYYGRAELQDLVENIELTISADLKSNALKFSQTINIVEKWPIPEKIITKVINKDSYKGLAGDEVIFYPNISNEELIRIELEKYHKIKSGGNIFPIVEEDVLVIFCRINDTRSIEIVMIWLAEGINKKIRELYYEIN